MSSSGPRRAPCRRSRADARRAALPLLAVLTTLAACSASPVHWTAVTYPGAPPVTMPTPRVTPPAGACPGSLRLSALGDTVYGAWWHVRADSSAVLMAGRTVDAGAHWDPAVPADTVDRSRRGCARPAPAVVAGRNGYVSFAYFLEAREGAGVFYTHSMDPAHLGSGNGVFHAPVAVSYGDRPARVALDTDGDRVAVAYEDPNAERSLIDLALSRTMGHTFDVRLTVSPSDLPGDSPGVHLNGAHVTVWWIERPDTTSRGRVAVRRGDWSS